jgi:hypothetical protein
MRLAPVDRELFSFSQERADIGQYGNRLCIKNTTAETVVMHSREITPFPPALYRSNRSAVRTATA